MQYKEQQANTQVGWTTCNRWPLKAPLLHENAWKRESTLLVSLCSLRLMYFEGFTANDPPNPVCRILGHTDYLYTHESPPTYVPTIIARIPWPSQRFTLILTAEYYIVDVNTLLLTVLGFVVGLSLSFRSSTAYERYSEGRKAWCTLLIHSRNLARYVWIHVSEQSLLSMSYCSCLYARQTIC
jgi:hypothetical protein